MGFLFGREIVLNVEELADLLDALVLDERGDLGAGELEQGLDVEVVGGHDELKQNLLLQVDELSIPGINHGGHVSGSEGLLDFGRLVVFEVGAELDDLLEDRALHVGQRDLLFDSRVVNESLDED